jgi:Bifunctional DNA primase/polymerase, N-terminal
VSNRVDTGIRSAPHWAGAARRLVDRPTEHPGPVARTGGGGWHLLYAPTGLGNRVKLLPGVDWRGRDGLIVAPPSQHTSGHRYTWARPLTTTLPEVPAELRRLLALPATQRTTLPQPPHPPAAAAGTVGRRSPGNRPRSLPPNPAAATPP